VGGCQTDRADSQTRDKGVGFRRKELVDGRRVCVFVALLGGMRFRRMEDSSTSRIGLGLGLGLGLGVVIVIT